MPEIAHPCAAAHDETGSPIKETVEGRETEKETY
jgi:hypothetical protein